MTEFTPKDYLSDTDRDVGEMRVAVEQNLAATKEGPGQSAASELTIAAGLVTPLVARHTIDTELDAAADDLDRMLLDNHFPGRRVLISSAANARVVTIKHGIAGDGNFILKTGADFVLSNTDYWLLVELVGTSWEEIDRWPRPKEGVEAAASLSRGYISGLVPTNNGASPQNSVDVSAGVARSADDAIDIVLDSAWTKRIDQAWTAGDGNGGLSSSLLLVSNLWYFVHAIIVDGSADIGFDTSEVAANLITDEGATAYRRIGAVRTDASSNILAFHSVTELAGGGLRVMWDTLFKDQDSVSTTPVDLSVTVPLGIRTRPVLHGRVVNSGSSTNLQMADGDTGAPLRQITYATTSGGQGWFALNGDLLTNLARQIRWQLSGTASLAEMFTAGWIDERRT